MLRNYFKIAFRNILRNKLRTTIHILGLGTGIAVCFIVFNVIFHAYSFDTFHNRRNDIYRVTTVTYYMDQSWQSPGVPFPLGNVIDDELAGIEDLAQFYTLYQTRVILPATKRNFGRSNHVVFADPGFFRIFQRDWLAGSPGISLESPNSVVISEASMKRYFPGSQPGDVLGSELLYVDQDSILVQVTGVVKDYTKNTDLTFTDFISKSTLLSLSGPGRYQADNWQSIQSSSQLFLLLEEGTSPEQIETGLVHLGNKYMEEERDRRSEFSIEPLSAIHFSPTYNTQYADKSTLKGLFIIGIIILLIACMNFINLETSQSLNRSKEVGIRKTLGSNKNQLIVQFLAETFVTIWMAIVVSYFLTELILFYFKDFLPQELNITFHSVENIAFLLAISLILTLISGFFPALMLSNYDPATAMKQEMIAANRFSIGSFLRKNLTVLQFTLSVAFIIGVLVINRQIGYLSKQELGFDQETVLFSRLPSDDPSSRIHTLKAQLHQLPFVESVSLSNEMISAPSLWLTTLKYWEGNEENLQEVQIKKIDKDFLHVHQVKLLSGRNIRETNSETLVNLALVEDLGFENPDDIIGEVLEYHENKLTVVGVTGDFNTRTLREEILPLILTYDMNNLNIVNLKLASGTSEFEAKTTLDNLLKRIYPDEEVHFAFLDSVIADFYSEDRKLSGILRFATCLAILISCLGLFGLSSFTISRRLKELSIRKVLGASVLQILNLISGQYLFLMFLSFLLGSIPAWLLLNNWLNSFSYRIDMPWGLFIFAGLTALILCLVIVGLHSMKAAYRNPAEILKSE